MSRPLHLLLVEDCENDALLVVRHLRQAGFDLHWQRVDTGPALSAALARQAWDIVIADHNMPQLDAPTALALVQQLNGDMPFLIVSGSIGDDLAVAIIKQGATDYLFKDRLARLGVAVELALTQRRLREEKRLSDDQLRASEGRFRAIIEHSADGISLLDAAGTIRFTSPSVTRILGYRQDEWLGRIAFDFIHPEDLAAIKALFREILERPGCNYVAQCRCRHKDDSWRWIETAVANYLADPAVQALVCNYRDITERKSAEQQAHELRLAGRIQRGFLPQTLPAVPGFDIAGLSYPAAATGGDYFDFIPLGNDTLGLVIGDVSGHGFASTLLMAETHAYLRALALSYRQSGRRCGDKLGQLIALLNQALVSDNAEDHFLSLLFACINLRTRRFDYVNAGHPHGLILDSSGAVRCWLTSTSLVLGIDKEAEFPAGEPLLLQGGDVVVFLTDGILEARAPDRSFFGTDRVLKIVRHYLSDSARDIATNIHHAVRAFSQDLPQEDDISVVVAKVV